MGLGSVQLDRQPAPSLTPAAYRWALSERIARMISAEDPEVARALFGRAEQEEGLRLPRDMGRAAFVLVETSTWLRDRAGYPSQPVPAPLLHDTETDLEGESLEAYLGALYHVSW